MKLISKNTCKLLLPLVVASALTACGGGPSKSELERACLDGGAKAFFSQRDAAQVCGCVVKQVKSNFKNKEDQQAILEHWQGQRQKTFGTSLFPGSVAYSSDYNSSDYTLTCEMNLR